jgi:biopolymer transport protein ExbD
MATSNDSSGPRLSKPLLIGIVLGGAGLLGGTCLVCAVAGWFILRSGAPVLHTTLTPASPIASVSLKMDAKGRVDIPGQAQPTNNAREIFAHLQQRRRESQASNSADNVGPTLALTAPTAAPYGNVYEVLRLSQRAGFGKWQLHAENISDGPIAVLLTRLPEKIEKMEDIDPAKPSDTDLALQSQATLIIRSARGQISSIVFKSDVGETAIPNLSGLEQLLKGKRDEISNKLEIDLQPDSKLEYGRVREVLRICHKAGFENVVLTRPEGKTEQ